MIDCLCLPKILDVGWIVLWIYSLAHIYCPFCWLVIVRLRDPLVGLQPIMLSDLGHDTIYIGC